MIKYKISSTNLMKKFKNMIDDVINLINTNL